MAEHRVHFSFWQYKGAWNYRFIGEGLNPIGTVRKTTDPRKLRDLAERGAGLHEMNDRLEFDAAINKGQGGLYLSLSDEQYRNLTKR